MSVTSTVNITCYNRDSETAGLNNSIRREKSSGIQMVLYTYKDKLKTFMYILHCTLYV